MKFRMSDVYAAVGIFLTFYGGLAAMAVVWGLTRGQAMPFELYVGMAADAVVAIACALLYRRAKAAERIKERPDAHCETCTCD